MAERKEYVDFMQYISDWKKMPAKEFAETHGDDILAALGELQREARLAEAEWWSRYITFPMVIEKHGHACACCFCERLAALRSTDSAASTTSEKGERNG